MHPIDFVLRQGHSTTLVLALLADGESHGYQLRKDWRPAPPLFSISLWESLSTPATIGKQGLTHSQWKRLPFSPTKRYAITPKGRAELKKRQQAWQQFTAATQLVLSGLES